MNRPDDAQSGTPDASTIDRLAFAGESPPLLLQKRVVFGLAAAFLALVAAYVVTSAALGVSYTIDAGPLREWVDGWGPMAPVLFVGIMALSVLFAPIPNAPIFVAAGLIWGSLLGTVYSMAGMMLGSTMAFYVSRVFGRRYLARLIGHRAATRLDGLAETMGGRLVFWARMLPVVNFDWISFLAGLTSIAFWRFFVFSFLGMIVPTAVAVVAGDGLGHDVRITLALGGVWVGGIVASAAFFWYQHRRRAARAVSPVSA